MLFIKFLEIRGNKKIETETLTEKIKSRIDAPLSQKTVQNDIKALYSLGYFDDVRVEVEPFEGGVKILFILKEKPTIIKIDFQGNREIETDEIKENITLTPGAVANHPLIMDTTAKIVSFYQSEGFWHIQVLPVIRSISDTSVALTFQIEEGPKVTIDNIIVEGNRALASKAIKKVMMTKKRWLFSFLTGSGIYKKEVIKADIERIKELYHSKGYIYVVVGEPVLTLSPDRKALHIKISVAEGDQYTIGQVSFSGNTIFSSKDLDNSIETTPGNIFNRAALRNDIDAILDRYMEKGYARADINPLLDVNDKHKSVTIVFSVTEGEIYRIGRLEITGNEKTRDKVIRREMRLDEGDIFNNKLLKRSYQRITNLDYFESVELSPTPRLDEQLIDIHVDVKEKLTGMLSIGGGYSSVDKVIIMGEISQRNLFGKGYYLKLRVDFSASRKNYNISFRDPWFMDKPVSASFSIYNEAFEYPDYDKQSTGVSVGFGKDLSEYVGGNITYRFEEAAITNVSEDASLIIIDQEGTRITSSISPSLWRDTRDNYLDPMSGSRYALYTTYAGIGGDNYFVKGLIDTIWYFPVIWNTTFSLRGRFGYTKGFSGRELPLYERFYIGGIDTVRGLGFGEGGPRDETGEVIGGTKELIFNVEYIFPIEKNVNLKGLIFFDAGRAFDDFEDARSLRLTTGVGVRWLSPFGPLRLEWGVNLSPKEDESKSRFEFSMGGLF